MTRHIQQKVKYDISKHVDAVGIYDMKNLRFKNNFNILKCVKLR